jgi:hypothetical protein
MSVDLAADAYVWGFPLVTMHRTRAVHGAAAAGRLVARDRLAGAADRTVVAPNHDTLYASGWFDLRDGDLTVEVGPIDRYWSVMLLDAYTHVRYVCRRLHGTEGTTVRVTFDPTRPGDADRAEPVVALGTPTAWVLVRVLVDGPDDLVAAQAALGRVRVSQPAAIRERAGAPPAEGFFAELRAALAIDPPVPWQPSPPEGMEALLDDPPPAPVLADAAARGKEHIAAALGADRQQNGWRTRSRGAAFGDDVAYRAAFARVSLAGHLPAENRGYQRAIDGRTTYRLRFPAGTLPPVHGFWSLTLYGPDLFLVANELDRHSVGDRSPGLRPADDGSVTLTIGAERPEDPSGWLPAPPGPCFLALRAYEGADEVVQATWFPPDLEPADAR